MHTFKLHKKMSVNDLIFFLCSSSDCLESTQTYPECDCSLKSVTEGHHPSKLRSVPKVKSLQPRLPWFLKFPTEFEFQDSSPLLPVVDIDYLDIFPPEGRSHKD